MNYAFIISIFIFSLTDAMVNETQILCKQKIAAAVHDYLVQEHKRHIRFDEIMESPCQKIDDEKVQLDYEFMRYFVAIKNPRVLLVYNIVHENISEK